MAQRVSPVIERLTRDRKITRSRASRDVVLKELKGAESDLNDARESFEASKYKWATIQGYYSIFHSARSLLYSRGFREKSHRALLQALRELFRNEISQSLFDGFADAMGMREAADYGLIFSEEGAEDALKSAEAFLGRAKSIIRAK